MFGFPGISRALNSYHQLGMSPLVRRLPQLRVTPCGTVGVTIGQSNRSINPTYFAPWDKSNPCEVFWNFWPDVLKFILYILLYIYIISIHSVPSISKFVYNFSLPNIEATFQVLHGVLRGAHDTGCAYGVGARWSPADGGEGSTLGHGEAPRTRNESSFWMFLDVFFCNLSRCLCALCWLLTCFFHYVYSWFFHDFDIFVWAVFKTPVGRWFVWGSY
jgi:hypothetical protein